MGFLSLPFFDIVIHTMQKGMGYIYAAWKYLDPRPENSYAHQASSLARRLISLKPDSGKSGSRQNTLAMAAFVLPTSYLPVNQSLGFTSIRCL